MFTGRFFAVLFWLIFVFAGYRVYRSTAESIRNAERKQRVTCFSNTGLKNKYYPWINVVTVFNGLVFSAALCRSVLFTLSYEKWLMDYPPPLALLNHDSKYNTFSSYLLLNLGTILISSVFVLVVCYWESFLTKSQHPAENASRKPNRKISVLSKVFALISSTTILSLIMPTLFLRSKVSQKLMLSVNTIFLCIFGVIVSVAARVQGKRMIEVLMNIEIINNANNRPQIRRVTAILNLSFIYFALATVIETTFSIALFRLARG
jgi:hypothetical protein